MSVLFTACFKMRLKRLLLTNHDVAIVHTELLGKYLKTKMKKILVVQYSVGIASLKQ